MNFRDASKGSYVSNNTVEHINAGSLQRIADAAEKMAQNHDALVRAKKSAEDSCHYWRQSALKLERRMRALRGYITRLKRR